MLQWRYHPYGNLILNNYLLSLTVRVCDSLVIDEVHKGKSTFASNVCWTPNPAVPMSVVFEILGLKARLQGLGTSAILVKHWETEVIAVYCLKP